MKKNLYCLPDLLASHIDHIKISFHFFYLIFPLKYADNLKYGVLFSPGFALLIIFNPFYFILINTLGESSSGY